MVYANESDPTAQAAHAASLYLSGTSINPSAYAAAYAVPSQVTNANLGGLTPPYTGGRIVKIEANRAGVDAMPEDTQGTEDLEQEVRVGFVATAGGYALFAAGGPIGNYSASNYQSPYLDPLWLVEASKQEGVKFF